jgi:hypothetical protein
VVFLRNCNPNRTIIVRTAGAPFGRVIPPGATSGLALDRAILADPRIQRRLAQARVAVLGQGAWHADLRQRRASDLDWPELIAQAERAEIDRLRQVRAEPDRRAYRRQDKHLRKPRVEWSGLEIATLCRLATTGHGPSAIARALGRPVVSIKQKLRQLRARAGLQEAATSGMVNAE